MLFHCSKNSKSFQDGFLPLPKRTLFHLVPSNQVSYRFEQRIVKFLHVSKKTVVQAMIEDPRRHAFFDQNCARTVLIFVVRWPALPLYLKQSPQDWRPSEERNIGEVKDIVKAIVVLLRSIVRQTVSNIDSVTALKNIRLAPDCTFLKVHLNSKWQLLIQLTVRIKRPHIYPLLRPARCDLG